MYLVFVYFLVSSGFYLRTLPWMLFLPSLFLIVESWTLTLIKASEAISSLDVLLGFFMTSWMSRHCTLGVILSVILFYSRPAIPGKVHDCSKFSPFVKNGSDHGLLESQSLISGFITLSRIMYVNYFVSHLFLNFFRSQHVYCSLSMPLLCQTGSI